MKKSLIIIAAILGSLILFCSCSEENGAKSSEISVESFKSSIIDRLSAGGKFDEWRSGNNIISYTRDDLEYGITASEKDLICSVSTVMKNTDAEYMKELTYYDIEKYDTSLPNEKKAGLDAVRYCAMALTCLCELQDEDAIDAALGAISAPVTENGWKISFEEQSQELYVVFTAEYVGQ